MKIKATETSALIINAPEWFTKKDFRDWLNEESNTLFTWHKRGEKPTEWSDVIVLVDTSLNGEGSDSDVMPQAYWSMIVNKCKEHFRPSSGYHIVVRITNIFE
jgi:hypothetical protein